MSTLTLWGLFGGFAVEAVQFQGAVRRTKGWPWRDSKEPDAGPFLLSVVLRLAVSAGLAAGLAASNQVSGPYGAIGAGVAAPMIIEQLGKQFKITNGTG